MVPAGRGLTSVALIAPGGGYEDDGAFLAAGEVAADAELVPRVADGDPDALRRDRRGYSCPADSAALRP